VQGKPKHLAHPVIERLIARRQRIQRQNFAILVSGPKAMW
jgi:hypothetical protein